MNYLVKKIVNEFYYLKFILIFYL